MLNALDRYNKFISDLEAYPEWKKKTEEEVGNWIHQIHNNIEESKTKRRIFEKMVIPLLIVFRTGKSTLFEHCEFDHVLD